MEQEKNEEVDYPKEAYYSLEDNVEEEGSDCFPESTVYDDIDRSGPNYSQAEISGNAINPTMEEAGNEIQVSSISYLILLIEVLLNPSEGWKKIRRQKVRAERVQQCCFYPLLALLAVSSFADKIYTPRLPLSDVIIGGVSAFISFFFGYFCVVIALKFLLKHNFENPTSENWIKVYVMYNLSSLVIFITLINFLPMLWAVLIFLPLWTVYITCRGAKFLKIPDSRKIIMTTAVCILIVGIPMLLDYLLCEYLPK